MALPSFYVNQAQPSYGTRDAGPDLDTPEGAAEYASDWDQYVGQIQQALQASSGLEREKLEAQMKDAAAGRANAYKIAQLQADTSRYGIDMQRKTALDQLKAHARPFDMNHAFEKEKFAKTFGLSYAEKATDYLSTPDRFAQGMDFRAMADRALQGMGPQPYGTGVQFQPKTEQDFAVLASYGMGNTPASSAWSPPRADPAPEPSTLITTPSGGTVGSTPTPTVPNSSPDSPMYTNRSSPNGGAGPTGTAPYSTQPVNEPADQTTGQPAPDPRIKILKTMVDAMPPSQTPGYDANDLAVMKAAQALYSTNLKPGVLQRMRPDQRAIYSSFIKRSGRSWADYADDVASYAPNQQSVRRV